MTPPSPQRQLLTRSTSLTCMPAACHSLPPANTAPAKAPLPTRPAGPPAPTRNRPPTAVPSACPCVIRAAPHPVLSNSGSEKPPDVKRPHSSDFPPPSAHYIIPRKCGFAQRPSIIAPPPSRSLDFSSPTISEYRYTPFGCTGIQAASAPFFSFTCYFAGRILPGCLFSVDFAPRRRSETVRIERRRDNVPLADSRRTGCQQQLVLLPQGTPPVTSSPSSPSTPSRHRLTPPSLSPPSTATSPPSPPRPSSSPPPASQSSAPTGASTPRSSPPRPPSPTRPSAPSSSSSGSSPPSSSSTPAAASSSATRRSR